MMAISMSSVWLRARRSVADLIENCRGNSATEFAMIVPLMLVMFFGTIEFSSGIAVDRKMSLVARTLSDLTSQSKDQALTDQYIQNVFTASISMVYPYAPVPTQAMISQIYVDSAGNATIQWSRAAIIASSTATQATLTTSSRSPGNVVTSIVPPQLLVKKTYLILGEASYLYTPAVGYVMKTGITLKDNAYTRPRQFSCLTYPTISLFPVIATPPSCPTL
jgi:Flp pilus assembly protein TadG